MTDIQVVRLSDVLPVTAISRVPGVTPRSVMLDGNDFENVEQVFLNGSPAPEFIVMSSRQILAQVPLDQVEETIREAYVLSTRLSFTNRTVVELSVGTRPQTVSGALLLVQNFVRMLLRTPSTNIFDKTSGGGLYRQIGRVMGADVREQIGAEVAVAISSTRQQFIAAQTPDRRIPPDERLLTAELIGLTVSPREGSIYASVAVTSHARATAAATIIR